MGDVLAEVKDLIGQSSTFNEARDPVNVTHARRWCDVMGETNPIYVDEVAAKAAGFDGIVAPPAMLDVWDKPGIIFKRDDTNPQSKVLNVLDGQGFTSTVAVNSDLELDRYLVPGEWVHSTLTLEDVSPEKHTGLGIGHFVTSRIRYLVGDEVVGSVVFRVLKFQPNTGKPPSSGGGGAAPTEAADERALPELAIPITTTLIVGGALMTYDYFDGHHDRDAAVAKGSKDVFMNIHTALGLVQRYISGWAGPGARYKAIRARLGAPNYPGDTMRLSGTWSEEGGLTKVSYRGMNSLGAHVTGVVELER